MKVFEKTGQYDYWYDHFCGLQMNKMTRFSFATITLIIQPLPKSQVIFTKSDLIDFEVTTALIFTQMIRISTKILFCSDVDISS